jgi:Ser/Thr protein kinase RdoA (MazF antagonist)
VKPFNELTRLGRLRRMRHLATSALPYYGLTGGRLAFIQYEGNVVFRVDAPAGTRSVRSPGRQKPESYMLRIHTVSRPERLESELHWLATLRREAGLLVPEPLTSLDGRLFVTLSIPGDERDWHISVMHRILGRRVSKGLSPACAGAWGKTLGEVHKFAAGWQPPQGFTRPYLGWSGLFAQEGGLWYPADELVAMMPRRYRQAFRTVTQRVRTAMDAMGKGPDAFGLIHGDMYLENVLFRSGEAHLIDFDDCGFGYWMYDIGVALSQWPWTSQWHSIRDPFLEAYTRVRTLPRSQVAYLDLFMAAQYAVLALWGTAFIRSNPGMHREHERWRDRGGDNMLRYLKLH